MTAYDAAVIGAGAWIWNGDWSVIPGYVQQFLRGEIPGIVDPAVTAP